MNYSKYEKRKSFGKKKRNGKELKKQWMERERERERKRVRERRRRVCPLNK